MAFQGLQTFIKLLDKQCDLIESPSNKLNRLVKGG